MKTIMIIALVLGIISGFSLSFIGGYFLGKYKAEIDGGEETDDETLDQDTTENNMCQTCIHKKVCKISTVNRCNEYEIENICDFCSKANSCEVKDYPVSKCKQYYYNRAVSED